MYMIYYIPNGNIPRQNIKNLRNPSANCLHHPNSYYAPYYDKTRLNKFRSKNDAEYCLNNLLTRFPTLAIEEFDIVRI
jgi:hypothetical protein